MAALHNVNFELLLRAHNGNVERARAAWEQICQIGKYGSVPVGHAGGLDVGGLRNVADEGLRRPLVSADDIKRIEDLASGDSPN